MSHRSLCAAALCGCLLAVVVTGAVVAAGADEPVPRSRQVVASAYNSLPDQTTGDPAVTACGDRLEPGMRLIAVSRDLFADGLVCGARVSIEGMPGDYRVADKMPERWSNKIDIYMGTDRKKALAWGKRSVRIRW